MFFLSVCASRTCPFQIEHLTWHRSLSPKISQPTWLPAARTPLKIQSTSGHVILSGQDNHQPQNNSPSYESQLGTAPRESDFMRRSKGKEKKKEGQLTLCSTQSCSTGTGSSQRGPSREKRKPRWRRAGSPGCCSPSRSSRYRRGAPSD